MTFNLGSAFENMFVFIFAGVIVTGVISIFLYFASLGEAHKLIITIIFVLICAFIYGGFNKEDSEEAKK